jgi:hypothetical protein
VINRDEAVRWDDFLPGLIHGVEIFGLRRAVNSCRPLELNPTIAVGSRLF